MALLIFLSASSKRALWFLPTCISLCIVPLQTLIQLISIKLQQWWPWWSIPEACGVRFLSESSGFFIESFLFFIANSNSLWLCPKSVSQNVNSVFALSWRTIKCDQINVDLNRNTIQSIKCSAKLTLHLLCKIAPFNVAKYSPIIVTDKSKYIADHLPSKDIDEVSSTKLTHLLSTNVNGAVLS